MDAWQVIFQRLAWSPTEPHLRSLRTARAQRVQHWATLKDLVFPRDIPPSLKEMITALESMSARGAPGADRLTVEMILKAGDSFLKHLHFLVCAIWVTESIPDSFLIDDIIPLFKRDERSNPRRLVQVARPHHSQVGSVIQIPKGPNPCGTTTIPIPPHEKGNSGPSSSITSDSKIFVLGEWLGRDPSRCPQQIQDMLGKMRSRAKGLRWILAAEAALTPAIMHRFVDSLLVSIARARLILTRITKDEMASLEAIQGEFAKHSVGVSFRASVAPVFADLRWRSLQHHIQEAKLLFLGSVLRSDAKHTKDILAIRKTALDNGDRGCFLGEAYSLLTEWGLSSLWSTGPTMTKKAWKRAISQAAKSATERDWSSFAKEAKHSYLSPFAWPSSPSRHLFIRCTTDFHLVASFRHHVTNALADKVTRHSHASCRFCNVPSSVETSFHLVAQCPLISFSSDDLLEQHRATDPPASCLIVGGIHHLGLTIRPRSLLSPFNFQSF